MLSILVHALIAAALAPCATFVVLFRNDLRGCTVAACAGVAAAIVVIVFYERYANLATAVLAVPLGTLATYKIQEWYVY